MIFETHAHYDDEAFDKDREELLAALGEQGIGKVVNIGASLASCKQTLALMERYPFVYGALGIHPSETAELDETAFAWLKEQCAHPKCVAVGEIGLDYHWPEPERELQKEWFIRQLEMAEELKKPIVIHSRDAAEDTIDILKGYKGQSGGVIHCFSYTKETAKIFLDMGFYIGIGGVVTFKNAKKIKEAVEYIPLNRIVVETDSPYLAPDPYRGKRNCSLYLSYIIEEIGRLKDLSPRQVEEATWENAQNLYHFM